MTVSSVANFSPPDSSPAPQAPKDLGSGDLFGDMLRTQLTAPSPAPAATQPMPPSDTARSNDSANNNANAQANDARASTSASASSSTQNDPSTPPSNPASNDQHESSAGQAAQSANNNQTDHGAANSAKAGTDKSDKTDAKTNAKKTGKNDSKNDDSKNDGKNDTNVQAAVQTAMTPAVTVVAGVAAPTAEAANVSSTTKDGGDASAGQVGAAGSATGSTAQNPANAAAQASALAPVVPAAAGASNSPDQSKDADNQNAGQSADPKAGTGFGQMAAEVTVVDASKTLVSKPPATRAPVRSDDTAASKSQDAASTVAAPGDKSATAVKPAGDGKTSDATPSIHVDPLQQLAGDTGSQPQKTVTDGSQPSQNQQQQTVTNTVLPPGTIVNGSDLRSTVSTLAILHGAQSAANTPSSVGNLDQVAVQITKAAADGLDKINIQLKPESLGRIDVQLQVGHNGQVNAVIAADRQDTLDLLRRDAGTLQQALNNAGLRADSGSLSFNLSSQGQNGMPQSYSNSGPASVPSTVSSDLPAVSPAAIAYSAAAARGGIDIQV